MGADRRYRVMIVDDQEEVVAVLKGVLALDHEVLAATSPQDALALLEQHRVDLIVADQRMPGMSGVEMLRRSIELNPDCVRILLTAYADLDNAIDAINRGEVYRFIQKPWDPREIRTTVRQGLERLEDHRALKERNKELSQTLSQLEKARERLLRSEKLALVGSLTAGIVHDIGNLLMCLHAVEVVELKKHQGEPQVASALGLLQRTRTEIQTMLAEVRDFAQDREGPLETESIPLADVIQSAVQLAGYAPEMRKRSIQVEVGDRLSARVNATQIKQVLFNLLRNATRATPAGAEIRVELRQVEAQAEIAVIDRGVGIPGEAMEKVWEPFYTSDPKSGTGLGLAIAKRVVERHEGTITCESQPDVGTTFRVRLPLA